MDIIDSAVCLLSKDNQLDIDTWNKEMERFNIRHSVIAPDKEYTAVFNQEGNEKIAKIVKNNPEKFSGLAVANPWYGPKALEMLEQAFNNGLCGLYINPGRQGFHLSEPIIYPLIECCAKHKKNVYVYTGTPIFSMPFQLAELARRFPRVTFIMGHCAWSDFWYDVTVAAQQAENIVIESSCTTGSFLAGIVDALGPDRVLFGSGYPRSHPENELSKIETMNLSTEVLEKLMIGNAKSIWSIKLS